MSETRNKLWYDRPARDWNAALPVGNGRLGAMVFGGVTEERLQLNEDTLWSNRPGDRELGLTLKDRMPEIRRCLRNRDFLGAEELFRRYGTGRAQACYQPLGDLYLEFELPGRFKNYRRELDLNTAVCRTRFTHGDVEYQRDLFASHPAQVLVIHCRASRPRALDLAVRLSSPHPVNPWPDTLDHAIGLVGNAPAFVLRRTLEQVEETGQQWKYPEIFHHDGERRPGASTILYKVPSGAKGMGFGVLLGVKVNGGEVIQRDNRLTVRHADDVVLVLGAGTGFASFNTEPDRQFRPTVRQQVAAALARDVESLRREHEQDYRRLFDRFSLCLGETPASPDEWPTDRRIAEFANSREPGLAELYVQYARYLTIAGSRPETQPLNLQGVWNDMIIPPWASCYTCNINVEMNYWGVEQAALSECHEPLFRLIRELAISGRRVARTMYGARGWVCHHNTTLWRCTEPVDGAALSFWPMGSGWLCQHLWTHFEYTGDVKFLAELLPVLEGAAEFYLDWLVEAEDGSLTTPAGNSPENRFLFTDAAGQQHAAFLAPGCTMDIAIIRELFENTLTAMRILNCTTLLRNEIANALAKLPGYLIGARGQLREWCEDFAESEPEHRHFSHIYPLHPGNQITRRQPELIAACRKTMELRGDAATGWSMGWKTNVWARLEDGEHALRILENLFQPSAISQDRIAYVQGGGSYPNLFCSHPPFQIDGNFGAAAGILEMLLQAHERIDKAHFPTAAQSPWPWIYRLRFLPALPAAWHTGALHGLRTRGGLTIDCEWQNGSVSEARIHSPNGGPCAVEWNGSVQNEQGDMVETFAYDGAKLFNILPKQTVRLMPK